MKKQTAVEWLQEQYYESEGKLTRKDFEQAKAMEKEQIEDAYFSGSADNFNDEGDFKKYYKQTYGGEE